MKCRGTCCGSPARTSRPAGAVAAGDGIRMTRHPPALKDQDLAARTIAATMRSRRSRSGTYGEDRLLPARLTMRRAAVTSEASPTPAWFGWVGR
jgi:hypothetical protein